MAKPDKIDFILDGQQSNNPREFAEIAVKADWSGQIAEEGEVSIENLSFVNNEADYLKDWIANGLNGGVGIFEGVPFDINVSDSENSRRVFKGYIDLTTAIIKGEKEVQASVKKLQGDKWLNEVANPLSFQSLDFSSVNTVYVQCIRNYVPDGVEIAVISLSLFMMVKELVEAIKTISNRIGELIATFTPDVVVGTAVEVAKPGAIAKSILAGIFELAYIVAIVIGIVELVKQLINQLYPPLRYQAALKVSDLFQVALAKVDLAFESSIFESEPFSNMVYLPFKDTRGSKTKSGGVPYPTAQDSIYTLGDLIRLTQDMFNAKFKIENGVFRIERRDYWENQSTYTLPDVLSNQDERYDEFRYNADEIQSNYLISFSTDYQDQNTLDQFLGTNYQIITSANTINNPKLVNIKNLKEVRLSPSRGIRKNELTVFEKILRGFLKFVDTLTGIFGKGTNFASTVENRIGSLQLSNELIGNGKLLIMQGNKLSAQNFEIIRAKYLWDNYHFIESFADWFGVHNQYKIYEDVRIPFSFVDFVNVSGNNFFTTADGNRGELLKLDWIADENSATVSYRIKHKYTNNLKLEFVEGTAN